MFRNTMTMASTHGISSTSSAWNCFRFPRRHWTSPLPVLRLRGREPCVSLGTARKTVFRVPMFEDRLKRLEADLGIVTAILRPEFEAGTLRMETEANFKGACESHNESKKAHAVCTRNPVRSPFGQTYERVIRSAEKEAQVDRGNMQKSTPGG